MLAALAAAVTPPAATADRRSPRPATWAASRAWRSRATSSSTSGCFNRPDPGVRITAGTKAIDRIGTEVVGDMLRVSTKSRGLTIGPDPLGDVAISLGVPVLLALRVDGRADVDAQRPLGEVVRAARQRLGGRAGPRSRRRPRDGGGRIGGDRPRRPGQAERERAHRRVGRRELRVARSLERSSRAAATSATAAARA